MSSSVLALGSKVAELLRRQINASESSGLLEEVERLIDDITLRESELAQHNEELRKAQQSLEAYRDRYIDLYDFAPLGYVTLDEDGYIQEINLAGAKLLGAERDALIGYAIGDYVANEDQAAFLAHLRQCAGERREVTSELHLVSKNGQAITAQVRSIPIEGPADEMLCKTAITDITERGQAEERLCLLVESAPYAIVIADGEGRIVLANAETEKLFGYQREELIGQSVELLVPEQLRGRHSEYRQDYMTDPRMRPMGTGRDLYARRKDGTQVPVEIGLSPVKTKEGTLIFASMADITKRKLAEEALRQAKADAEKANEAKGRFLAYVSHDLRTPMNSILGMVDLALERTTEPTARSFLQTAKESADLLLALLNDLLDTARIEAGKLELETTPFSLRRVLDQTTRVLSMRASQKGISFSCCIPPEVPDSLVGDQVRLRQILLNLVGNAIKFTEQGEVAVSVRIKSQSEGEASLEFAVLDTGVGIPHSDVERIFQRFAQANSPAPRRSVGTGLGLYICSNLATMMGGRIWVESEPAKGSTFYFTVQLPLARELSAEPEPPADVSAKAISVLRILLADDNPANRRLAAYVLQERGHAVEVAESGREAFRMAQENDYDAILMDVEMPDMNGLEATVAIRADERGRRRVPIIAMTAYAMMRDREQCLEAGMDGYLSKPIDRCEMIALVETLAASKATRAEVPKSAVAAVATSAPNVAESLMAEINVFDPQEAMKRCFGRQQGFQIMVDTFFKDVEKLLPQMCAALRNGDVVAVGELGHRLKGTLIYLGAKQATEAALRVEQLARSSSASDAEETVAVLERECEALKKVLIAYQPVADVSQDEVREGNAQ